jgi:hypothetical protein
VSTVRVACVAAGLIGRLHRFRVNLGGRDVAILRAGQFVEVPVRAGPHLIKVTAAKGAASSPSILFRAGDRELIAFRCGPTADTNFLETWKLSFLPAVAPSRQAYDLFLERDQT